MKLNLPNKLTVLRVVLIPFFMFFILVPVLDDFWSRIIAAVIFLVTALTDLFDGKIARKNNLVTDFGKFMDPLADKFMVFGALLSISASNLFSDIRGIFVWVSAIVIFRELAVTSVRLVAAKAENVVIAASWLGKLKTAFQCICIMTVILEPVIIPETLPLSNMKFFSYITIALMLIFTVYSGIDYMKSYWQFIDPQK